MIEQESNLLPKKKIIGGFLFYMITFIFLFFVTGFLVSKDAVPPDPNDPAQNPEQSFEIADKQLARIYWSLKQRVEDGDIDEARLEKELQNYAKQYSVILQANGIAPQDQFRFGQVLRTGHQWKKALAAYTLAQQFHRNNGDLWTNSTLRMAHCNAELGNGKTAIELLRSSFVAAPGNKVGILLAAVYEITPPLVGKGLDHELAMVLLESIEQHRLATVDKKSDSGVQFLFAKRTHISKALILARQLLGSSPSVYDIQRYNQVANEGSEIKI